MLESKKLHDDLCARKHTSRHAFECLCVIHKNTETVLLDIAQTLQPNLLLYATHWHHWPLHVYSSFNKLTFAEGHKAG